MYQQNKKAMKSQKLPQCVTSKIKTFYNETKEWKLFLKLSIIKSSLNFLSKTRAVVWQTGVQ